MIHKTRGIVFRFTRYGDTSIIVSIFTEHFGLQSYMINGVRSAKAKNRIALFQPLTLLNLVVYHRENANIERIREVSCFHPYTSLLSDVRKASIAMFLTELLNRCVKEESHAEDIFKFMMESLISLDQQPDNFQSFHLIFMMKLSHFLGFGLENTMEITERTPVDDRMTAILKSLLASEYNSPPALSNAERREALNLIVRFYSTHIEDVQRMKSLEILREVFG